MSRDPARWIPELRENLKTGLPEKERAARVASVLRELFRSKDEARLRELEEMLRQSGENNIAIGAEFFSMLGPSEWKDGLVFLDGIQLRELKYEALGAVFARMIVLDPQAGTGLYEEFSGGFPRDLKIHGMLSYDMKTVVWSGVGSLVANGGSDPAAGAKFLSAASGDREALQAYLDGLGGGYVQSMSAGTSRDLGGLLASLSGEQRVAVIERITRSLETAASKNAAALGGLIGEMDRTPGLGEDSYRSLGRAMDRAVFEQQFLREADASSPAWQALVQGWAAARPKAAVEAIVSKTGSAELARPAFSSWTEADSMEASKWLLAQPSGKIKEACTEELCGFLLKKGSTAEAEDWLTRLSPEARERVMGALRDK
ncbi:hypothetical protein [Luteolibacter sp. LG18]|uniref:hypothetical protein n=1 Tax=Luteolibacter sp. LG18 TaxID=2819286 RepID=UPI0030C77306